MADWTKLIRKHQSEVLLEGEEILATLLTGPHGSIKNAAIAGGVGGVLGSAGMVAGMRAGGKRALDRMAALDNGATLAGSFPVGYSLVSITTHRVLVFMRGSVQSKKPEVLGAAYPREALVGASTKQSFMKRNLTLRFSDGSDILLDTGMGQPFKKFEAAAAGQPIA